MIHLVRNVIIQLRKYAKEDETQSPFSLYISYSLLNRHARIIKIKIAVPLLESNEIISESIGETYYVHETQVSHVKQK